MYGCMGHLECRASRDALLARSPLTHPLFHILRLEDSSRKPSAPPNECRESLAFLSTADFLEEISMMSLSRSCQRVEITYYVALQQLACCPTLHVRRSPGDDILGILI